MLWKDRHGEKKNNTVEYKAWENMKQRCYNTNFHDYMYYGGRGIKTSLIWKYSYLTFLRDMGRKPTPKHTLDRIDCDKGYNKNNCRWATMQEQNKNRRYCR